MKTILSTKKLSLSQKEHLLNAQLAVVDVNFIATTPIPFLVPKFKIENAIFTSLNGVKAVIDKEIVIENSLCVGNRTEQLLHDLGVAVQFCAPNAQALSEYIITKYRDKHYHYFCAKDRLNTLPDALTKNKINWDEIPVYKTILTPKKYEQQFNGVLFFSPSGVASYFAKNKEPLHSFCIGETTAKALKKYTKNYTVASQPSIENVLIKAIKHFRSND
ncbi:uroporphyrinogen-III synthase [Aquimarina agarivorans]|uniref:uroporphyrinogen-III synthase n=1 Tax=Aquimarina agarivorans TaxID=980584 RepID=UPI000248E5E2|nr:uroporphyrinogen-III synthase [Aquimarina agarivorans]